nr:hypothetical protein BHI3_34380 [Bacteriovorax sp. HI3]
MKKIILLASVLFSSTLLASTSWSDLELYDQYKSTQDIAFENGVVLPAGQTYELRQIEPLTIPGYPMFYLQFHQMNCVNVDQTAEMSLLEVKGGTVLGIDLEEGCNVGMYLEVKDYYKDSAFE